MVTTQSADSVLKSYYLDAVAQQLDLKTNPLLAAIERTTSDVWGKDVKKPVIFGVHGGVSAGKEDGSLPSAAGNGYAQLTASLKNLYGQIEITDKALRASQSNEGAFVDLLDTELTGLVRSASFNLGRMLFGDGSGKLGTISSAADGVYTMDSVRNFAVGQVVDVANSGGTTIAYGRTVTGVDRAKKTITLSGAGLSAAGGAIYVQGSQNLELTGLGAIFSSSETLYGLPREGNGWLNPHIVTEVGALTENAIQKAIDMVEANGGGNVNFIVCSWGVRRALFELLAGQRALPSVELEERREFRVAAGRARYAEVYLVAVYGRLFRSTRSRPRRATRRRSSNTRNSCAAARAARRCSPASPKNKAGAILPKGVRL